VGLVVGDVNCKPVPEEPPLPLVELELELEQLLAIQLKARHKQRKLSFRLVVRLISSPR
jgi:hypothetical protein